MQLACAILLLDIFYLIKFNIIPYMCEFQTIVYKFHPNAFLYHMPRHSCLYNPGHTFKHFMISLGIISFNFRVSSFKVFNFGVPRSLKIQTHGAALVSVSFSSFLLSSLFVKLSRTNRCNSFLRSEKSKEFISS